MPTNFPTSLDALTNPVAGDSLNNPSHAGQHANANDAIEALQAKVGVNGSAVTTSLDYKVSQAATLTDTQTLTNKTLTAPVLVRPQLDLALEQCTTIASAPPGQIDIDMVTGKSLRVYTVNTTQDFQFRIRWNGGNPGGNMPVNTSFTFAVVVQNGATAYKSFATISIDGNNSRSVLWQGGTVPAGNANSRDVYVLTIAQSGTAGVYTVLGSQTKFA